MRQVPQIEVAVGDDSTAIVIRHLAQLTDDDAGILRRFEQEQAIRVFLQAGDTGSVVPLTTGAPDYLSYRIDNYNIGIDFGPLDFTQINFRINQAMIDRVMEQLAPQPGEAILDLFCGLGNFTLPIATRARAVTGVEGSSALTAKAAANAARNGIVNAEFMSSDLYVPDIQGEFMREDYDKLLLDPPRSGAKDIIEQMKNRKVSRLVYVSCNPATLARDAGILVKQKKFTLESAGIMDMFPHTTHVESMAVFTRQ
jgi:23S rRNA (uracil1939-C5)-methyltransferase